MTNRPVKWLPRPVRRFYKRTILRDPFLVSIKRWQRDRGDERLRLDYQLTPDSVVLDIGGYRGDFAHAIVEKFGCRVLVFEPMPRFFRECEKRFADNKSVSVFNYGLGAVDEKLSLSDSRDASSFYRDSSQGESVTAEIRDVDTVWRELGLDPIDLVKINIEGGEYPLLRRMIESGLADNVKHFQVQFHDFVADAAAQRDALRQELTATHEEAWCYHFVWESWKHRKTAV